MRPGLRRGFGELIWVSRTWLSNEQKNEITICLTRELPDGILTDLAEGSYNNIASKLTKVDKLKLEQQ